jgi:hypothetical protein
MLLTCGVAAAEDVVLSTSNYKMRINPTGFRYSFEKADGKPLLAAHAQSGLQLSKSDGEASEVTDAKVESKSDTDAVFTVTSKDGAKATVTVKLAPHRASLSVKPTADGSTALSPVLPASRPPPTACPTTAAAASDRHRQRLCQRRLSFRHGRPALHAAHQQLRHLPAERRGRREHRAGPQGRRVTEAELAQGSRDVRELPTLAYFFGTPREIYADYLALRNDGPVKFYRPKYEFFGVGWEAFGALAWDTNEKTVYENVTKYLDAGYPLSWMVVGSGFWPRQDPKFHATTSFGMWDKNLYPHPKEFIEQFKQRG